MSPRLKSRVAIVTGSSSGIGRAISLALHHEGAHIICADLRPSPLLLNPKDDATLTHEAIHALGGSAIFVKTDVSKASEVEHLVAEAVRWRGRLDIMVNDAAVAFESAQPQPVWGYDEGHFDTTMAVNCKGVWLGCKFAARQMIGQEPIHGRGKRGGDGEEEGDRGWIVNVSSVYGLRGAEGNSGYCASKHAVLGLTKVTALDCAPYGVHCNAICPGYTLTSMTEPNLTDAAFRADKERKQPLKGLGRPDDLARAVVFLCSEDSGWITGVGMPVDGGYTAH